MLNFDREKLTLLLTDFYCLTDIKICVCDEDGNEVSYVPEHLCAFADMSVPLATGEKPVWNATNMLLPQPEEQNLPTFIPAIWV